MSIFTTIANWFKNIFKKKPTAPAPTPPLTPVPVPAPVPTPPPVAVQWTNGMSQPDARGFVQLQAIEQERASNPAWANAAKFYNISDILKTFILNADQLRNVGSNGSYCNILLTSPLANPHPLNAQSLSQCFQALAPTTVGAMWTTGPQYDDALSFPIGSTNPTVPDPTVNDLATFIANCNAAKQYPVINHSNRF